MTCRDPHTGFIAHVPKGSIAKGEAIATTGAGGRQLLVLRVTVRRSLGWGPCPKLPGIRQTTLFGNWRDFKSAPNSELDQLMKGVVVNSTQDDIVSLAAYVASRNPEKQ